MYDITVIGGGPAGYVGAIKAAQLGANVCLIEKDALGGTCLNRGCIPTKTYLEGAEVIEKIKNASKRGIMIDKKSLQIDLKKAVSNKNRVVRKLVGGIAGLLKANGITVINGTAVVNPDLSVTVDDNETVRSKKIILATGSKPFVPPIPGVDLPGVMTSDEILDITEKPESLVIIGGGVIGIEMARIFSAYGTKVTIIETLPRLAPFLDEELSDHLRTSFKKHKVDVMTDTKVESITEVDGALSIAIEGGEPVLAEKVLVAIGRKPDLSAVENLDITIARGFVVVDEETMETSVPGLYAPGDVNGLNMLAHAASKMAEIAAENAMGHSATVKLDNVPGVIYGFPEVGCVGLTEAEAAETHEISIGRYSFQANGRALASGEGEGFVKLVVESKYKEILGAHIVGPKASELINEIAALMEMEVTAEELAEIIHAHPTNSEALMEAAADSLGRCIHGMP